jgi:hypothetical protein
MTAETTYYAEQADGLLELRQTRFIGQRQTRNGQGHRHDVCAVARSRNELQAMADRFLSGDVDWSRIPNA